MLPCCGSKIGSSCTAARQIRVKGRNSTYKGTRHGWIHYLLLAFYANERESPRAKTSRVNVQAMSHVSGLQLHAGEILESNYRSMVLRLARPLEAGKHKAGGAVCMARKGTPGVKDMGP